MSILLNPAYLAMIGRALGMTLFISGFVILASNLAAFGLCVYMRNPRARLRPVVVAYSLFARASPVLALLFVLYYGLPKLGIYLEPLTSALIGLTFGSAAYNYEFLRAGFDAVPASQLDAAKSLGLGRLATVWKVLTPQAYRVAAPALFSNAVQIVKGSSLASLVAIDELTAASSTILAETYKAIEVLLTISLIYGLVSMAIVGLQYLYESRQAWSRPGR
ncbi:MAG TPA: amino acid ABC transporter permease [Burkholderiales bacterium]|nr:amino acid ABC transporter permease [Burkholderiales bacterium]